MGLLDSILGRSSSGSGGMSPLTMALLGILAYRTVHGKGRLAEMLGRSAPGQSPEAPPSQTGGGIGGLLSGFLGGAGSSGGILSGGLGDLLRQFEQNGMGDKARSWIGTGANQPIGPSEVEKALGPDKIDWLVRETGMPREQLLAGLSRELPETVDKLTPQGRIPSEQEAQRMA
jgi:uncharacterized protein YidB (DUF937 family)